MTEQLGGVNGKKSKTVLIGSDGKPIYRKKSKTVIVGFDGKPPESKLKSLGLLVDTTGSSVRSRKRAEKKAIPEVQELGFVSKTLFMCSMPHEQPKNSDGSFVLKWKRENGNVRLDLTAHPDYGLPAGKDKLLGHWLKTKSVMRDSPIIYFDDGASILNELGLDPKGDNKIWLNGAINRLLYTSMSYTDGDKFSGGSIKIEHIIKEMNGYFDKKNHNSNKKPYFVLSDLFFNVPGVPIDLNMLRKLGRAYSAIDFFTFLQYRLWFKTKDVTKEEDLSTWEPLRIPLRDYQRQSGSSLDAADKHFKQDILRAIQKLKAVGAEFEPTIDDNNVITVPIVRPNFIWTLKNQIARQEWIAALERVKNSDV